MEEDKKHGQLNIEITDEVADGTYANLAIISHSSSEFIIDFIRMMPGVPKAKVKSRVLLTPQNAKKLMRALGENISKFEDQNGSIKEEGSSSENPPVGGAFPMGGFGGPSGQA